jgi:integrase
MGTSYRVRIGLKEIAAMEPNTILWDLEVRGFVARRQHSDIVTFSVVYRTLEGTQRWQKLERFPILTPHLARQEAIRILRARALGQDPAGEKMALRNGMTVADLCDQYSARDNGKKLTTIRSDRSRINAQIKPKLGQLRVASITTEQIEDFMHSLSAGNKSRSVGLLGAIFAYALKRKLRTDNPCRGIEKPAQTKKTRRLSDDEYAQLGASLKGGIVSDIFKLLAITGWRSSEAKNLRWSECDLPRQVATLEDTKSGMSIRPLSKIAVQIIEAQQRLGPYVFDHGHGKPIDALRPNWMKLEMPRDISPHVLRHSFASLAADMGLSDNTIASLLGHARQSITSRYLHGSDKALIESANIVANETLRLMKA